MRLTRKEGYLEREDKGKKEKQRRESVSEKEESEKVTHKILVGNQTEGTTSSRGFLSFLVYL